MSDCTAARSRQYASRMARNRAPSSSSGVRSKTYSTEVVGDPGGSTMTSLNVPFDPAGVFGRARPPVVVKIGKTEFRSTIFNMKGERFVPLRRSNREAAGVEAGQRVRVTLTLDDKPRVVKAPRDLQAALKAAGLADAWKSLSFTHQREHVEAIEEAKRPETRQRRLAGCLAMVRERASRRTPPVARARAR